MTKRSEQVEDNEIVKAVVTVITDTDVILNIGFKSDGMIPRSSFKDTPELPKFRVIL